MENLSLFVIAIFISLCDPCIIDDFGVNLKHQKYIVKRHNAIRDLILQGRVVAQPKGVSMKTMQWDDILAEQAQKAANSCHVEYSVIHDSRWSEVGENIDISFLFEENTPEWNRVVGKWYRQHRMYKYPYGAGRATRHYTQIVWSDTDHIGCGFSVFRVKEGSSPEKFYVCFYGPGGNVFGQPPYVVDDEKTDIEVMFRQN